MQGQDPYVIKYSSFHCECIEKKTLFLGRFSSNFFVFLSKNQTINVNSFLLINPVLFKILVIAWLTVDSEI